MDASKKKIHPLSHNPLDDHLVKALKYIAKKPRVLVSLKAHTETLKGRDTLKHIEADTKWPSLCRRHFQIHFIV